MPTIDINRYAQDIRALVPLVTDVGTGTPRVQRAASTDIVDVTVTDGTTSVTILLKVGGLYVKGFRNAFGTHVFKGEDQPNQLMFGCNYTDPQGLAIFSGAKRLDLDMPKEARTTRARDDIVKAIQTLAAFRAGTDIHLKIPLTMMAFMISESIRFTIVYDRIVEACKANGKRFSFEELEGYVKNWAGMSTGEVPAGLKPNTVFTSHS